MVLEIDTEEHLPPPVTSSEILTMAEEDSPEADKFRVISNKLLQGWRHEAEESRSQ